jgi:Protein of unknown function (DUF3828)
MKLNYSWAFLALTALALLAGGCTSSDAVAEGASADASVMLGITTPTPTALPPTAPAPGRALLVQDTAASATPEEVAQNFYDWYLSYAQTANPLLDKAYQTNSDLAPELIAQVDKTVATLSDGGLDPGVVIDPFLCAQDIPDSVRVGPAEITGERAQAVARTSLDDHWLDLSFVHAAGRWQITGIACGTNAGARATAGASVTPEQVVKSFYDWYLAYARRNGSPLVGAAYKASPYLSAAAVHGIESILAAFGSGPGYDPVLCAQNVPLGFTVDPAEVKGDTEQVFVRINWQDAPSTSQTVSLKLLAGEWKIDGLTCAIESK